MRSPTAERVFSGWPGIETDSAGTAPDADTPLSADAVADADMIVVMERRHKAALLRAFPRAAKGKRILCLDIPDRFTYMQPELVTLLEDKVGRLLGRRR